MRKKKYTFGLWVLSKLIFLWFTINPCHLWMMDPLVPDASVLFDASLRAWPEQPVTDTHCTLRCAITIATFCVPSRTWDSLEFQERGDAMCVLGWGGGFDFSLSNATQINCWVVCSDTFSMTSYSRICTMHLFLSTLKLFISINSKITLSILHNQVSNKPTWMQH